ncbi:hypothetical protein QBS70_13510 [Cronobacter sakazakii]|nr:hypothetical protein [Cronobacter sakazakii]
MKAHLLALPLLLCSAAAWSMSCDNPRSPYDTTYCAALEMVQGDRDLNQQYKNTMSVLSPAQKQVVKKRPDLLAESARSRVCRRLHAAARLRQ